MIPADYLNKKTIPTDILELPGFEKKGIGADVLRLDKIHPVISGNKWFKLKNYFLDAIQKQYKTIVTFGGAYSNHIVATAYAANQAGFESIGIIRGEEPPRPSYTLQKARQYGMKLQFISRKAYRDIREMDFQHNGLEKFAGAYIIPEGG